MTSPEVLYQNASGIQARAGLPLGDDMRKALLVATAAASLTAGLAVPAGADTTGSTETTFTLTAAGGLAVTAPSAKNFASVALGQTASEALGTVGVTDDRGVLMGSWTATVSSTDFITGDRTAGSANLADRTIPASAVTYVPPVAVTLTGLVGNVGTFVPGGGTLDTPRAAVTATALVGRNSVTWDPTISVAVPNDAVAGTYSGTITHSVA